MADTSFFGRLTKLFSSQAIVTVDKDGKPVIQQLDQSKLIPLLTKALQEQQATIEVLTARVVTLENA